MQPSNNNSTNYNFFSWFHSSKDSPNSLPQSNRPTFHEKMFEENNKIIERCIGNSLPKTENPNQLPPIHRPISPTFHEEMFEKNNKIIERCIGNSLPKPENPNQLPEYI